MIRIAILILVSILMIILWHKKINPKTTWIYLLYSIGVILTYIIFSFE